MTALYGHMPLRLGSSHLGVAGIIVDGPIYGHLIVGKIWKHLEKYGTVWKNDVEFWGALLPDCPF